MIWFIAVFVFLIIEALTTNLVTIWFAVGSLFAFISTFFTDSLVIQLIVFSVFSIITLIITKPLVKKYIKKDETTNYDRIIGKTAVVIKKITKHENGRVKIDGKDWMAASLQTIDINKEVIVIKIDGVKLIVKEKEN